VITIARLGALEYSSELIPSLTNVGSSSSCSSLASLSSQMPVPNEHLAVLLSRNLWKQDTDTPIVIPLFAANPSPSWKEVMYVHHMPACLLPQASCPKTFFLSCSIAESPVASFAVPPIQLPFSMRPLFPLCTLCVQRPSPRMHLLPRLFFLQVYATLATLEFMAQLPRPVVASLQSSLVHSGHAAIPSTVISVCPLVHDL
jgi:hypothetical protein